eukprot:180585_1
MCGDQGVYPNSFEVIKSIENELEKADNKIRLLLHIGDLSYGMNGQIWYQILQVISYMISIGNHEYDHMSIVNNQSDSLCYECNPSEVTQPLQFDAVNHMTNLIKPSVQLLLC